MVSTWDIFKITRGMSHVGTRNFITMHKVIICIYISKRQMRIYAMCLHIGLFIDCIKLKSCSLTKHVSEKVMSENIVLLMTNYKLSPHFGTSEELHLK